MMAKPPPSNSKSSRQRVPGLFTPTSAGERQPKAPGHPLWLDVKEAPPFSPGAIERMPEKMRLRFGRSSDPEIRDIWNKVYTILFKYARNEDWLLAETMTSLFHLHFGTIAEELALADKTLLNTQFGCKDVRAFCMALQEWVEYWWDPLGRLRMRLRPVPKPAERLVASNSRSLKPDKTYLAKHFGPLAFRCTVDQNGEYDSDEEEEYLEQFNLPPKPSTYPKLLTENMRRWIYWVILRHFPIEGCTIQEITQALAMEMKGSSVDQRQIKEIDPHMKDVLRIEMKSPHHHLVRIRFDIPVIIPKRLLNMLGLKEKFASEQSRMNDLMSLDESPVSYVPPNFNTNESSSSSNNLLDDSSSNISSIVAPILNPSGPPDLTELNERMEPSLTEQHKDLETVRIRLSDSLLDLVNVGHEEKEREEFDQIHTQDLMCPLANGNEYEPTLVKLIFHLLGVFGSDGVRVETLQYCINLCRNEYGLWKDVDQADLDINQVIDGDVERISSQPTGKGIWIRADDFCGQQWSKIAFSDNTPEETTDMCISNSLCSRALNEHMEQLGFEKHEIVPIPQEETEKFYVDVEANTYYDEFDDEVEKSEQIQLLFDMVFDFIRKGHGSLVLTDLRALYEIKYPSDPPFDPKILFTKENKDILVDTIDSRPDIVQLYKNHDGKWAVRPAGERR